MDTQASPIQIKYINQIRVQVNQEGNALFKTKIMVKPPHYRGNECPDISLWYHKPVMVCNPAEQFKESWGGVTCKNCKSSFNKAGWLESVLRVHGLEGSYYLLQKKVS